MPRRAEGDRYALESVDRMAAVLAALEAAPTASLDEVARRAGLNQSTALRYLLSLARHGLADRDPDSGLFRLGLGLFRLGMLALDRRDVVAAARPVMEGLAQRFGESVNLAVNQGGRVVLLHAISRADPSRKEARVGEVDPWHATSLGKAILSAMEPGVARALLAAAPRPAFTPQTRTGLDDIERDLAAARAQGYAVDDEEVIEGLRCVGAPVPGLRDDGGYAISVSGPKSRMPFARIREVGEALAVAAADLSRRLGHR